MLGRFWCRLGVHRWFTTRLGCDEGDLYGVPAAWGITACARPGCTARFQWVGDDV